MIGIGAMGSAIAQTLIDNQCDLTVWNRSSEKVKSMVERGASSAETWVNEQGGHYLDCPIM
ncbi:MAG: NAD(P)-binding domain-containing protein, partial [Gammaproteobacteria bacterium]